MPLLRKVEWTLVLVATALSVWLHGVAFASAGALWRDEANSINMAQLPNVAEIWRHIEFDSFPMLWFLALRGWSFCFGLGDVSCRVLGMAVGLGILSALWFNARVFKISFPLVAVALVGFSPAIIKWGDSMRGAGLGICAMLFTLGLTWRVVQAPARRNVILAALVALAAVQIHFYNAVLIFAVCMGGFAVAAGNRAWNRLLPVLLVGVVPALSLLPYLAVLERAKSWSPIVEHPELWQGFEMRGFWPNLRATFNGAGSWGAWIWIGLLAIALASGFVCLARRKTEAEGGGQRDRAAFAGTALVVGLIGYYLFLRHLQFQTQAWYYISLIAFMAMLVEVLLSLFDRVQAWRALRVVFSTVFIALSFWPAQAAVRTRMTNVDLIAAHLEKNAAPGDVILVTPWYCGISFSRYYHGNAVWTPIPEIGDLRFHRLDLLREQMTAVDQREPVRPVLEKAQTALAGGHRIWIVGHMPFLRQGQALPLIGAAPDEKSGWHEWLYYQAWAMQVAYFLQTHATGAEQVEIPAPLPVNEHENLPLVRVEGRDGGP